MKRLDARAVAYDVASVLAMVIIGTRNHDTDTGPTGIAFVAAPFLIGLAVSHALIIRTSAGAREVRSGLTVVAVTVIVGMLTRNVFFDRGTAPAFIIVASVFLGLTMMSWRVVANNRS